jgi:hypothetical protein
MEFAGSIQNPKKKNRNNKPINQNENFLKKKIIFSTYLTSVKEPKIRKGNSLREPGFGFSMHEINTFITIVNIESKNLQKYSSNNSQRNLITSTSAG